MSIQYMGSGDYLHCTSNVVVNADLSATVTLELCNVCYKSMQSITNDPGHWISNAVHNRARKAGDELYKKELDRHVENGTMPSNPTKGNLILEYQIPVVVESFQSPKVIDPIETDLQTTRTDLQTTRTDLTETQTQLQTTQTQIGDTQTQLQTTQTQLGDTQTQLGDTQTQLETTRTELEGELQTARTQLQNTRTELEITNLKLHNAEARIGTLEQTMTSILSKLNV